MEEISHVEGLDPKDIPCITDTRAFKSVCLDVWVLQVAWSQFRQQYGKKAFDGPEKAKLRHIAYRQFVRWCKENRVVLPSCVVTCIRAHFPEAGEGNYKGFKLPSFHFE